MKNCPYDDPHNCPNIAFCDQLSGLDYGEEGCKCSGCEGLYCDTCLVWSRYEEGA
jgi:hypothetical protein